MPWCRTSATSRTRRRIRFATRGVPRARRAISSAASSAISTPRMPRRAANDRRELLPLVVPEPERHPEAVAQRRRQETRARRRADERERRQVERQRPRSRALADDDVEPEVLERRVEDLLDRAVEAMDLVDEEDVPLLEAGEDRGHVALALERGPGDRANADAELLANDRRERRLPETRRAGEQDVVERLAASLRRRRARSRAAPSSRSCPTKSSSERGRSDCSSSSSPRRISGPGTGWSRGAPERLAHALLDRQLGIDAGERSLGLDERVAELDERVARDERRAGPRLAGDASAARRASPSSSSTTRCAVFLPIPGIASKRAVSSSAIARRSSAGVEPETIASATLGPMPLTPSRAGRRGRARPRRRSRRAAARPRARGGTSRPSPPSRRRRAAGRSASPARGSRRRRRRRRGRRGVRPTGLPRSREITAAPPLERRRQRMADRDGERVRRVVRRRHRVEREDHPHHPLHLPLLGASVAAHRLLDPRGRVLGAFDAGGGGRDEHGAARLPDGERDAGVGTHVGLLERDGVRLVLRDELPHSRRRSSAAARRAARAAGVRQHPDTPARRRPSLPWTIPYPHVAVPGSMPRTFTYGRYS